MIALATRLLLGTLRLGRFQYLDRTYFLVALIDQCKANFLPTLLLLKGRVYETVHRRLKLANLLVLSRLAVVPDDHFHGPIQIAVAGSLQIQGYTRPQRVQIPSHRTGTIDADPSGTHWAVDFAVEFVKGTAGPPQRLAVFKLDTPKLQENLAMFTLGAALFDIHVESAARLQRFAPHVPAGAQYFADFKESRSHDFVGKLSVSHESSRCSVGSNYSLRKSVHAGELQFCFARLRGIKIEDANLKVERNSEFVAFQENNPRPRRIQIVEDPAKGKIEC